MKLHFFSNFRALCGIKNGKKRKQEISMVTVYRKCNFLLSNYLFKCYVVPVFAICSCWHPKTFFHIVYHLLHLQKCLFQIWPQLWKMLVTKQFVEDIIAHLAFLRAIFRIFAAVTFFQISNFLYSNVRVWIFGFEF